MKCVFLGSAPFATPVLERLLASDQRPSLVVTPPARRRGRGRRIAENPVAALARAAGVALLEPASVREPDALARLAAEAADVFLVVSYGELLRAEFLALPRQVCLNVHPSLLPRWRGATPIPAAIRAGDAETGTTIQKVVLALDAGDVLVQKRLAIGPDETTGTLAARLALLSGEAALEALRRVADGSAVFTPQDPARVTLCRKLEKDDGALDWSLSAAALERHVRAMNPWPLAFTHLPDGRRLNVLRARVVEQEDGSARPGALLAAKQELVVATGDAALRLVEVQLEGKKALPAADFLLGARLDARAVLG